MGTRSDSGSDLASGVDDTHRRYRSARRAAQCLPGRHLRRSTAAARKDFAASHRLRTSWLSAAVPRLDAAWWPSSHALRSQSDSAVRWQLVRVGRSNARTVGRWLRARKPDRHFAHAAARLRELIYRASRAVL